MAYGSATSISYLGAMAAGAMADGLGFAPGDKELRAITRAEAGNHLLKISNIRSHANQPSTTAIDGLCNRDISGSGAFVGTVPSDYTSTVGVGLGLDRISAHTTLMFGSNPIQMTQTFFAAESLASNSESLAPTLNKLNQKVNFGKIPNADTFVYPADGVFPNYLGSGYPDMQAVVTNGVSTFVTEATTENFQLLASDLTNLGSVFNIEDIANFGNPGQVVAAIAAEDGLGATGLDVILAGIGLDPSIIYNLGNPSFNTVIQSVLDSITLPELLSNAQTLLETNIVLESLGDYTNFDKIFVNSKDIISFSTMAEFVEKMQAIELGRIDTLAEFASYINTIEPVVLPTIGNTTIFTRGDYTDSLINKFLGGTGPNNSITLIDIIGSLGGQVIDTLASNYRTKLKALYDAGELNALRSRLDELYNGLDDVYGTEPTIVDPFDSTTYLSYSAFQSAKISQLEDACAALMSRRNVNSDIQATIDAWRALLKKIYDEKDFQSRIDMGYDIRTSLNENALSFIQGLRGNINEYQQGSIINGMVDQAVRDGDVGAEYVRAYIKELENKTQADSYDIRWRAEFDE